MMLLPSLSIAGLALIVDSQETGLRFNLPESHGKFQTKFLPHRALHLQIKKGEFSRVGHWEPLFASSTFWELWQQPSGDYLFIQSNIAPPQRHIVLDKTFKNGVIYGNYQDTAHDEMIPYPLQNIEINLFINWLAEDTDLVLHAVGIKYKGSGYCFVGPSGVGKSTLASALVAIPGLEILGEDNIILQRRAHQFWIFGTPWHENAKMCAADCAPLEKIYFLDRTITPGISPCSPIQGVIRILQTAFIPYYRPELLSKFLTRLIVLSEEVPFAIFHYLLGSDLEALL